MKKLVDMIKLREIRQEAIELKASGGWTPAAYKAFVERALEAAHGKGEYVEFLFLMAEPSWPEMAVTWKGHTTSMPGMNIPPRLQVAEPTKTKAKRVYA